MPETIKEFLVSLGWRSDEGQQRKFTDAITEGTLKANLLGAAIEDLAGKLEAGVKASAAGMADLAFLSARAGADPLMLRAMRQQAEQMGRNAGEVDSMVDSLGRWIQKMGPDNAAGVLKQLGVNALDPVTHKMRDTAAVAADLGVAFGKLSDVQKSKFSQEYFAGYLGVNNFPLLTEMAKPEFAAGVAKLLEINKSFGISDETFKAAKENVIAYTKVWQDLGNIIDHFAQIIEKATTGPLERLTGWLEASAPKITKFTEDFVGTEKDTNEFIDRIISWTQALEAFNERSKSWWIVRALNFTSGLGVPGRSIQQEADPNAPHAADPTPLLRYIWQGILRRFGIGAEAGGVPFGQEGKGVWGGINANLPTGREGQSGIAAISGNSQTVNGMPISDSNPMPVRIIDVTAPGGMWGNIASFFGFGGGGAGAGAGAETGDARNYGANKGAAAPRNTADAMRIAMDELAKMGVKPEHLRAAAAELVGQATAESGLNPSAVHDQGTGYGIYGARLGRRDRMLDWLAKNGYTKDSLEGQMRYMAHEAMGYPKTRAILEGATAENIVGQTATVTGEFEGPAVINPRGGFVSQAYRAAPGSVMERPPSAVHEPSIPSYSQPIMKLQSEIIVPHQYPGARTRFETPSFTVPDVHGPASYPAMGGAQSGPVSSTINNHISISAPDPHTAAAMVGMNLDRTSFDASRNLQGKIQ